MGMFAHMTDVDRIENRDMKQIDIRVDGDIQNLLYRFLSEWLEVYGTEDYFIARKIEINLFDRNELRIIARGYGETFDLSRHTQGTEVKAITYSNMQIHEKASTHDVYVIVDI
jgi:SHS2 domain-containing protein